MLLCALEFCLDSPKLVPKALSESDAIRLAVWGDDVPKLCNAGL